MEESDLSSSLIKISKLPKQYDDIIVEQFEEAIQAVNPNGKYQIISMILLLIAYTSTEAFLAYGFSYLERDPIIHCYTSQNQFHECNRIEACGDNKFKKVQFNFIDETYSWNNDFKMTCKDNWLIGLFGTGFFFGTLTSTAIVGAIADKFGRSSIIKASIFLRTGMVFIPLLFPTPYTVIGVLVVLGFLNAFHSTVPYILIGESVSSKYVNTYLTIMFISESLAGITTTIFFTLKQNWMYFFIFNGVYSSIFVLFSWLLLESPQFLLANRRFNEARSVLRKISKMNTGKKAAFVFAEELKDHNTPIISSEKINKSDLENATKKKVALTIFDIFRLYPREIIVLPLIWLLDAFAFFAINFMVKYFKGDLIVLNIILFASEIISLCISNLFMKYMNKITLMSIFFLLSGIAFFVFFWFDFINNQILLYVLTFCSKFGACIVLNVSSIYTNETFNPEIRGRAISICSFIGKFGSILAPLLNEITSFVPIISGSLCVFASLLVLSLPNHSAKKTNRKDLMQNQRIKIIKG